jgi:hypothetical protein
MLQKIKDFFAGIAAYLVLGLTLVIGFLIYSLSNKKREVQSLKAQIALADTQKAADLIEVDIKQRLENKALLQKEVDELQASLVLLEDKRKEIATQEASKTPEDIQDFWKKN